MSIRRNVATMIVLSGMVISVCPSWAVDVVTLKEEAYVKGPSVVLGELADIEGENARYLSSLEIVTAAPPGNSMRLDAALLAARVKTAAPTMSGIQMEGAQAVRATTLHHEITRQTVSDDLRRFIESEMPWNPANTEIEVSPPPQNFVLPEGEITFQWRPNADCRYLGATTFRGSIAVDGETRKTFLCKATIESYGDIIIAAASIPRGKAFSLDDIKTERRPLSSLKDTGFTEPTELAGCVAGKPIAAGEVISRASVKPLAVVKKRQLVSVETYAGRLAIQTQAQAEADAAVGEKVTCTNLNSKESFVGVVRQDGVVVVR